MSYNKELTDAEREYFQKILIETPINHKYDDECELFDCNVPPGQISARLAYELLKELNELPKGIAWIEEELKREKEGGNA